MVNHMVDKIIKKSGNFRLAVTLSACHIIIITKNRKIGKNNSRVVVSPKLMFSIACINYKVLVVRHWILVSGKLCSIFPSNLEVNLRKIGLEYLLLKDG